MLLKISIMSLQARKLSVIEYLVAITDERELDRIEAIIAATRASLGDLTEKQLLARARQSESDYANGRVTAQDNLERESKLW